MSTLGIDLGTASVKVAVVDDDGTITSRASHPVKVRSPRAQWVESDPRDWVAAVRSAGASALVGAGVPDSVGFSGQMHGVVVADERLVPLRPAILWADARSTRQASELAARLGRPTMARLGSPALAGFAATSLAWIAEHEPEVMARARYVLQPKDWMRAALGGAATTDPSDASGTLLYDVAGGHWSSDAVAAIGLDRELLPEVAPSNASAGAVRIADRELAAVVGGGDTACALAALGEVDAFVAVGSGAQVVMTLPELQLDPTLRTHTFARAGDAGWYRLGAVAGAGLVVSAAVDWLGASVSEANTALIAGVHPADPIFVPFLAGARTPFMDPALEGAWIDMVLETGRDAMLRSVLEGVAQAIALALDAVRDTGCTLPDPLVVIGGGTHETAFRQLLADATGLSLAVAHVADATVVGAARLAAASPIAARVRIDEVVSPRASATAMLRARRARLVASVEAARDS